MDTNKTPIEDLVSDALEHYEEAASKVHHWNSLIPKALKFYQEHCGQVDAIVNGTKWRSVEEEPLADITIERDEKSTTVTYDNYLVGVDMLFAVPLGNGEYSICRGYIEDDGSIQESFQSGENEWWGYSLEDVTHYMQIFNPK